MGVVHKSRILEHAEAPAAQGESAAFDRSVTRNKTYATCAKFAEPTLGFLREKVFRKWSGLREPLSDNFRVISPEEVRLMMRTGYG
jgi:hypothetical protein